MGVGDGITVALRSGRGTMRIAVLLIVSTVGLYEVGLSELAEFTRIVTTFVLCTRGGARSWRR